MATRSTSAYSAATALNLGVMLQEFPVVSETFILDQITGAMQSGVDVHVFADRNDGKDPWHPEAASADLLGRVTYYDAPRSHAARAAGAGKTFLEVKGSHPRVAARAIDFFRYGISAASLRLLYDARRIAGSRFDLVHAHFGPTGVRASRLRDAGAFHAPLLTSFYGYDVTRRRIRHGYRFLFAHGECFTALSEYMRDQLIDIGCASDRIVIHRLGVDTALFVPRENFARDEALRVLSVARLVEKKGIQYGIRAVALLAAAGVPVEYTIIGDGPLRASLNELVQRAGVASYVRFAGAQSRPAIVRMMRGCDALLAPSVTAPNGDSEGTPVAILEAQACGLPVVATRHSGIPEIVSHGTSGLLADERDYTTLAGHLRELASSPELRQRLGAAGRANVVARHDIRKLNAELVALYRKLSA